MTSLLNVRSARPHPIDTSPVSITDVCACVTHDHESGVLLFPTLADVRATGFFTHGDETVFSHYVASSSVAV